MSSRRDIGAMTYAEYLRAMTYDEYLATDWWRWRRARSLWLAGHRCQRCGAATALQVHHGNYDRLGCETDGDLEVLCERCHHDHHFPPAPAPPAPTLGERRRRGNEWAVSGAGDVKLPPDRAVELARSSRRERVWTAHPDGSVTDRRPLSDEVAAQARALGLEP